MTRALVVALVLWTMSDAPAASPSGPPPTSPLLAQGRWSPEIHAGLEQMIVAHGSTSASYDPASPPLAVLDWDNTCIRGDITESIMAELDARDSAGRIPTYEQMCAEQGDVPCYLFASAVLAGLTERQARDLSLATIEATLADGRIVERPEMSDLIWALQRHGWEVWIVSAGVYPAVHAFAQRYGVSADRVIAVRPAMDDRGVLQEHLAAPLTYRQGKVDAIEQHVGRTPVFAAGDTFTDLEMLRSARFRLLMDRGIEEVREIAHAEGWWIQEGM